MASRNSFASLVEHTDATTRNFANAKFRDLFFLSNVLRTFMRPVMTGSSQDSPAASAEDGYRCDRWPLMPDGTAWDGKNLLQLLHDGKSPVRHVWDVKLLLEEVETEVQAKVVDIPKVHYGANNYGFHLKLSNHRDVLARIGRADVNMPDYDGFALTWLHDLVAFEAAVYLLLGGNADIPTSCKLYFRHAEQSQGPRTELPKDISGRRLTRFDMSKGATPLWGELNENQRGSLLTQVAKSSAALLDKPLTTTFVATWLFWTSFQPVPWMPEMFPLPTAANRSFCIAMRKAKVEGLIGEKGDSIGWEEDNLIVGPRAFAAKQSLLRFIPRILPEEGDGDVFYRFVLQHNDFGIRNMAVDVDETGEASLISVYDWETGCVIPIILTGNDFSIAGFDLIVDEKGEPAVPIRSDSAREPERRLQNQQHAVDFLNAIYERVPYLKKTLHAGNDARRLWSTLKRWKGDDPEEYFGELGSWAEARMSELEKETQTAQQPSDMIGIQGAPQVEKTVSSL